MTGVKIYKQGTMEYIRISELPDNEREAFEQYLVGQTVPIIDIEGAEDDAAFVLDYKRFKQNLVPFG